MIHSGRSVVISFLGQFMPFFVIFVFDFHSNLKTIIRALSDVTGFVVVVVVVLFFFVLFLLLRFLSLFCLFLFLMQLVSIYCFCFNRTSC